MSVLGRYCRSNGRDGQRSILRHRVHGVDLLALHSSDAARRFIGAGVVGNSSWLAEPVCTHRNSSTYVLRIQSVLTICYVRYGGGGDVLPRSHCLNLIEVMSNLAIKTKAWKLRAYHCTSLIMHVWTLLLYS